MILMDKKDLQLIDLLGRNCRLPHVTLAKAVNLSKDTIRQRISALEKENVITHYNTIIDLRTINVSKFHILIKFKSDVDKKSIIECFIQHPSISFVNSFIGKYDLQLIVDTATIHSFEKIKREILNVSEGSIQDYIALNFVYDIKHTNSLPETNLGTKFVKKSDASFSSFLKDTFEVEEEYKPIKTDLLDINILNALTQNPKKSLTDLSEQFKVNRETIKNRIQKLIQGGTIKNFGANPSFDKFNYTSYFLLVKTNESIGNEIVKKIIRGTDNIFYSSKVQGAYDILIYVLAKSPKELKETMEKLQKTIGKSIIAMDVMIFDELLLYKQLPKGVLEELKKNNNQIGEKQNEKVQLQP